MMEVKSKKYFKFLMFLLSFYFCSPFSLLRAQGILELSTGGGYTRTNFSPTDYNWSRRYYAAAGYYFLETSQLEISFQNVKERTRISNYQDTTFEDSIYSLSWLQGLTSKNSPIQPYLRLGVGQLNREASGTYASGAQPPTLLDAVTVVLGAGIKIRFTQRLGIKIEGTSYLERGSIGTWKDNIALSYGVSFFL